MSFSGKLNKSQGKELLRRLFKCAELLPQIIAAIMDKNEETYGQDCDEAYWQLCMEWFRKTPREFRKAETVKKCLEEMRLNGLGSEITVISPGAKKQASQEIIQAIDLSDPREMLKRIAKFLNSLEDLECKNMAFDMLLKLVACE